MTEAPTTPIKRPTRWLDRLTAILLCVGAGGAIAAAAPPLLRSAGVTSDPDPGLPPASAAPSAVSDAPPSTTWASDPHPRFAPDDEEPRVTELERQYPDGMWPGRRGREPRESAAPRTNARSGHTRAAVTVRERVGASSPVAGRIPAGQRVMVIRDDAGWVLVVHQGTDGITMGWVEASLVSIP